jgi:hypothetical protein
MSKLHNNRLLRAVSALPYGERASLLVMTIFRHPGEPTATIKGLVALLGVMTRKVDVKGLDVATRAMLANRLRDFADRLERPALQEVEVTARSE